MSDCRSARAFAAYCAAGRERLGAALASCAAVALVVALRGLRGAT